MWRTSQARALHHRGGHRDRPADKLPLPPGEGRGEGAWVWHSVRPDVAADDRSAFVLPWGRTKGATMVTTTVSSKFQVVIPLAVRSLLTIAPGDRLQVLPYEGRIELIPIHPVTEMRGLLAGIDTDVARDDDRV